jgi:hypothetical protein
MQLANQAIVGACSILIALFATASPGGERANAPSNGHADRAPVEAKKPTARFDPRDPKSYVNGVWSAMKELRSGVVRIREDYSRGGNHRQLELYCGFDHARGDLRFDTRVHASTFARESGRSTYWQYARNRNEVLVHQGLNSGRPRIIFRRPRDYDFQIGWAQPLRLRMLPVFPRYLQRSRPKTWHPAQLFRELFRRFADTPPNSAELGKRIVRFTWIMKSATSDFRYVLEFDRKQGNRIVKMERTNRPPAGGEWRLHCSTETTWTRINKTWVPKKIKAKSDEPATSELSFEWESVNKPVPAKVFRMEGFALPIGTQIINYKSGKRVYEGKIGMVP